MKKFYFFTALLLLFSCENDPIYFTLSASSSPEEGGIVQPQIQEYPEGSTGVALATPKDGYKFVGWTGDAESSSNVLSTIMDRDKNVVANFEKKKYTLTVEIEGEGTVEEKIIRAGTVTEYDSGTIVELTAIAKDQWEFISWKGDLSGNKNPEQITIDEDKKVTAVFNHDNPVYLDENGVTIKARDWAKIGDSGVIKGKTYTIVDIDTLKNMVKNGEDVSNVCTTRISDISYLFMSNKEFNQNIISWDTSNVVSMSHTFHGAISFNQNIGKWDTTNVKNMSHMLSGTYGGEYSVFNQDISSWDVSNVTDMSYMFMYNGKFNQPINNWNVSSIISMNSMFWYAKAFNQDLNNWDVSNVKNMLSLFDKSGFNGDVSSWDVSNVTNMFALFAYSPFNKDISNWDTSNVTNMHSMFEEATEFNGDLNNWDVSNVIRFRDMFNRAYKFNKDISSWNVKSAEDMIRMFQNAKVFDQNLSSWCAPKILSEPENFSTYSNLKEFNKPFWGICKRDGLIAWYPFSGNANDESGNDKNGEVRGATLTTDRFGNEKSAYHFTNNQDIIIPETENYGNVFPLTVSLWYKVDKLIEEEISNVFSKYVSASWNGYQILHGDFRNVSNGSERENNGFGVTPWYVNGENRIIGYYDNPPFIQEFIEKEVWYHYVFVADESGGKIYVNGELIDSQEWNGTPTITNNSYKWKIGGNYEPGKQEWWFNGKIDDLAIWNKSLNSDEIKSIYNQN